MGLGCGMGPRGGGGRLWGFPLGPRVPTAGGVGGRVPGVSLAGPAASINTRQNTFSCREIFFLSRQILCSQNIYICRDKSWPHFCRD